MENKEAAPKRTLECYYTKARSRYSVLVHLADDYFAYCPMDSDIEPFLVVENGNHIDRFIMGDFRDNSIRFTIEEPDGMTELLSRYVTADAERKRCHELTNRGERKHFACTLTPRNLCFDCMRLLEHERNCVELSEKLGKMVANEVKEYIENVTDSFEQ